MNFVDNFPEDIENTSERASTSGLHPQSTSSYSNMGTNQKDSHFIIAKSRRNTNVTDNPVLNAQHQSSEESDSEERFLVVYCRAGRLGAAYYTLQNGELFILEEIVDRPPEFQMFCNLFRQVEPVSILLDGKTQGSFVQKVRKTVFDDDTNGEGRCKLVFLSTSEYSYEACKRRVLTLTLPNEPSPCSDEERTLFLRTVVDFSQVQSVHALGALLRYLDLNWSSLSLNMLGKPQFLSLRIISLADIVTIDEDTYRGLQIFSTVAHPSGFKKGVQGSSREGLSLCQLFSKCSSKVGQSRMRVYLQHPTRDLSTLKRRQDVVAFFIRPQNDTILKNICSSLRFIKNVNIKSILTCVIRTIEMNSIIPAAGILAKITALSAKPYQWKSLYNTLYYVVLICEMCENVKFCEFLEELAASDNNKLYEMALYMNRIIDFDISKSEGKFTVKAGVDPELDIKLDVMIGDTYPEIVAHETRIMMRLTAVILENLHTLADVIEKCAELDCLIAISKVCKEYNYVRPVLTEAKVISIQAGRHPLHILTCDNFVPNDVDSAEDSCVKILTGPNSSGKSVYMKMIGLIVYLAHIGSFVPAESATIGVVSRVHSRIQAAECVAQHMSAFLIDLSQMAVCIRESSSNSLVLIDEFGRGTARADGLALLAACINTMLFQGPECPHTVISTHYLNIKEFVVDSPLVKFLSFEHLMADGSPVFLYRTCAGAARSSLAHAVAHSHGVEQRVVTRAQELLSTYMNNTLPAPNKNITMKLRRCTANSKTQLFNFNV